jgi:hypothetical protein
MPETGGPLTLELLPWVSVRPRTYAEAMEAWRTTCPRHSGWDDTLADELIEIVNGGNTMNQSTVALSALGRAVLGRKT